MCYLSRLNFARRFLQPAEHHLRRRFPLGGTGKGDTLRGAMLLKRSFRSRSDEAKNPAPAGAKNCEEQCFSSEASEAEATKQQPRARRRITLCPQAPLLAAICRKGNYEQARRAALIGHKNRLYGAFLCPLRRACPPKTRSDGRTPAKPIFLVNGAQRGEHTRKTKTRAA